MKNKIKIEVFNTNFEKIETVGRICVLQSIVSPATWGTCLKSVRIRVVRSLHLSLTCDLLTLALGSVFFLLHPEIHLNPTESFGTEGSLHLKCVPKQIFLLYFVVSVERPFRLDLRSSCER